MNNLKFFKSIENNLVKHHRNFANVSSQQRSRFVNQISLPKWNISLPSTNELKDKMMKVNGLTIEAPKSVVATQMYMKAVYTAFESHFHNDEEMQIIWSSLSAFDFLSGAYKLMTYRESRIKNGSMTPPQGIVSVREPEIDLEALQDWLYFAEAAYEENEKGLRQQLLLRNHQLITHERNVDLFEPAHYLSMSLNENENIIVIGIKGTSSLDDWLTNMFIEKQDIQVSNNKRESESFCAHGGVVHAARFVLSRVEPVLRKAFYKAGFSVVIVGHSLGAGVATVLAFLLREELKMERVTCYAYAPPPAVSKDLAIRVKPYVTSVINNVDAIPRTSVKQLKTLIAGICKVTETKKQLGDWTKLEAALDILPWSQIEKVFSEEWKETRFETFIGGRILFCYDYGEGKKGRVELPCDAPNFRIPILSPRMVSDHTLGSYKIALEN